MGTMKATIPRILATVGLLWSVWAGVRIWTTPVVTHRVAMVAEGSNEERVSSQPFREAQRFAEVSPLGALPLLIPVALAALAVFGAWIRESFSLTLGAVLLLGYSFVTGFSIGGAYVPAALCLVAASSVDLVQRFRDWLREQPA